jgi:hypothetical protein
MLSDGTGGGYSGNSLSSWVGFADPSSTSDTIQVIGDLGAIQIVHSVQALTQSWSGAGILHPSRMLVEVSEDGVNWTRFGATARFPSNTQDFAVMWGKVDNSTSARFVRWTFTYTQWLFLAELEVIGPR